MRATTLPWLTPANAGRGLVFTALVAIQVLLFVQSDRTGLQVAAPLALLLMAYVLSGRAVERLLELSVIVLALLPYEFLWGVFKPELLLPAGALVLWLGETLTARPNRVPRLSRLEWTIIALTLAAVIGALNGLGHERFRIQVGRELQLYLCFPVALLAARTEWSEAGLRRLFGLILLVTVVVSLQYLATFAAWGAERRAASDQQHLLNLAVPLLAAFYLRARGSWQRLGYGVLLIVLAAGTYVTQTRALWLYVPFSVILLAIMLVRHGHVRFPRRTVLVLAGLLVAVVALRGPQDATVASRGATQEAFAGRAETFKNLDQDLSLLARYELALQAYAKWRSSPVIGTGLGDWVRYRLLFHAAPDYLLDFSYLTVLWKTGLVGLVPFLILYGLFMQRLWYVYRHATDEFQMLCAAATFTAFVALLMIGIESGILIGYRFNLLWALLMGVFERWYRQLRAGPAAACPASGPGVQAMP